MSRINLQTSDEIISFLRILAEESVSAAKETVYSDNLQSSLQSRMKADEDIYGSLDEQDDEQDDESIPGDMTQPDADAEPEPEKTSPAPEAGESQGLEVSLDSISSAVNDLRSGRSVDDSRMKEELRAYFDRLEPAEKEALYAFLKAFAGILTGAYPGSEAPDPSDPPYSISMGHGKEQEDSSADEPAPEQPESPEEEEDEVEEEEPADSPPIRAGASQDLSEIRKRVKSLMHIK